MTTVNEKRPGGVTTTLDSLPFGTDEDAELDRLKSRKERRILPETVESKSLYRDIMRIAWPSLCELFLQSLVSMVDMMMVGGCGPQSIAAIGLAMQPRMLILTAIMALNTGATATIARARGAHDQDKANAILRQVIMLCTFFAAAGMVFGTWGSRWMITFMANGGITEETIALGTEYLQVQMLGFPVAAWSVCITAALRGTGNSKPCMVYNILANLVNICGNWILINGHLGAPALGVVGASLATVFGQFVATVIAFWCVFSGKYYLKLDLHHAFRFDKDVIANIGRIGGPAMLEQLVMRCGQIFFSRTVNTLGDVNTATHQICINIQSMSFMVGQGFAVSATALVGQSLGRRRLDMAEHYSLRCRRLSMGASVVIGVLLASLGSLIIGEFYTDDPQVIALAADIMIVVGALQPFQSVQFVVGGVLRGAGDTKSTAIIMFITVVIIRTIMGYIFVNLLQMGLFGAWIAISADQIMRAVLIWARYNQGKWKKIRL